MDFLGGSVVKNLPAMQETQVSSLEQEDLLEKEMTTHSSILAQRIPWTEEPGRLQSMWLQSLTQCKEIEENNRMGKTRDLIKKIRDTKGKCNAKMGTIKDRNGMDLT